MTMAEQRLAATPAGTARPSACEQPAGMPKQGRLTAAAGRRSAQASARAPRPTTRSITGRRGPALVALVFAVGLVTAACGNSGDASSAGSSSGASSSGGSSSGGTSTSMAMGTTASGAAITGAELDKAFVTGMLAHHRAATDMAKVEVEKGKNADVKALAQRIIDAQTAEIEQLTAIGKDIGASPSMEMTGPMGSMMGVPMTTEMSKMAGMVAASPNVDMMFLQMMIPHHASAIGMANEEQQNGANADLVALAKKIIKDQAKEIGEMQSLLDSM